MLEYLYRESQLGIMFKARNLQSFSPALSTKPSVNAEFEPFWVYILSQVQLLLIIHCLILHATIENLATSYVISGLMLESRNCLYCWLCCGLPVASGAGGRLRE